VIGRVVMRVVDMRVVVRRLVVLYEVVDALLEDVTGGFVEITIVEDCVVEVVGNKSSGDGCPLHV